MPVGWEYFLTLKPGEQLNRVTAAMENHTLPADVLVFFEKEIFNRQLWAVTRNNMGNALVWQESPNPRLHELFAKMLADESESPAWRDYCLQFLSECLKSSSDPEAIQAILTRRVIRDGPSMLDRGRMKWYGAANHEAEEVAYAIITGL
jgi:hypothetical protein